MVVLQELNWLAPALKVGSRCGVQVRYRSSAIPATVASVGPDRLTLALDTPARAITPGQSGVLYDGARVLGGGVITRTDPENEETRS
jgi:tRNA-specific 2-thiouridylase